ncbi:MAG: site-2 protease family protein, partial [Nitrospinota bacterium]
MTPSLPPSQPSPLGWPPGPQRAPFGFAPGEGWERPRRGEWAVPLLMLLVTVLTTMIAGAFQRGVFPTDLLARPGLLAEGLPFSLTLLLILGAHESGHFLAARRWGVDSSLPYFIPAPTLFGTFGAIIRIRGRLLNRNALMDVAAAGPLAGLAVALPVTLAGLSLSRVVPAGGGSGAAPGLGLGTPWLFDLAARLVLGPLGERVDVVLHPVAFAGWCGFLVTALNLIPAGQLDGGHIIYTLFGRWHRAITGAVG